jgi:hypothetical protein
MESMMTEPERDWVLPALRGGFAFAVLVAFLSTCYAGVAFVTAMPDKDFLWSAVIGLLSIGAATYCHEEEHRRTTRGRTHFRRDLYTLFDDEYLR